MIRCAWSSIVVGAAFSCLLSLALGAQDQPASIKSPRELCASFNRPGISAVAGIVREPNGTPVPFATINFEGGYTTTGLADRTGCFVMRSPRNALLTVDARRIGFQPYSQAVDLVGDSTVFIDVRLASVASLINGVQVTAPRNDAMERTGFYDRMLEREKGVGDGYFVTPEDIERRNEAQVTHLLEGYPNITVQYDARDPRKGYVYGRGFANNGGTDRCLMTVFLDGSRVPSSQTLDALDLETAIAAVEIYPSPMQTPPQFQSATGDGACGSIVLWTKRPDFTKKTGNWFKQNLLTIIVVPVLLIAILGTIGKAP